MTLALLLLLLADDPVAVDAPLAGWRATDDRGGFIQPVQYPASVVNVDNAEETQQIRGHVAAAGKTTATLVVDGNPMPLRSEEDGTFARPWSFGRGGHGIELRTEEGRARRQFYEMKGGVAPKLRVLLSWDTDETDVDLHVVGPTGEHTFYGDRVSATGGALDVDVTTGFGPEIYAHPAPPPGVYNVYVNYYGSGERPADEVTVAQVTVLLGEGTPQERRQQVSVPLREPGDLTRVFAFSYP